MAKRKRVIILLQNFKPIFMTTTEFDNLIFDVAKKHNLDLPEETVLNLFHKFFSIQEDGTPTFFNPNAPIFIYCLINPIDESIFYVGRTSGPLEKRLYFHKVDSNKCNIRKTKVFKSVKEAGKKVEIKLLEEFKPIIDEEYKGTHPKEWKWIKLFLSQGQPLTNRLYLYNADQHPDYIKGSVEN